MVKFTVRTNEMILEKAPRAKKIPPKDSTHAINTAIWPGEGRFTLMKNSVTLSRIMQLAPTAGERKY